MSYTINVYLYHNGKALNLESAYYYYDSDTSNIVSANKSDFKTEGATFKIEMTSSHKSVTIVAVGNSKNIVTNWITGSTSLSKSTKINDYDGENPKYCLTLNYDANATSGLNVRPLVNVTDRDGNQALKRQIIYPQQQSNINLPYYKILYSLNNSDYEEIEFDAEDKQASYSYDGASDVYVKAYVPKNVKPSGYVISRTFINGTTAGSGNVLTNFEKKEQTDKNYPDYYYYIFKCEKSSATKIYVRLHYNIYTYKIDYQDLAYEDSEGKTQVTNPDVNITSFYNSYNYTFYYPPYNKGKKGGWATKQNGPYVYDGGGNEQLTPALNKTEFSVSLWPAYKSFDYLYTFVLYNNDGTTDSQTITFYREKSGSQSLTDFEVGEIKALTPTRPGYRFLGWGTSSMTSTVTYDVNNPSTWKNFSFTVQEAISKKKLYAVWKQVYEATFYLKANGGRFDDNSEEKTYPDSPPDISETEKKVPSLPEPNKDNCKFLGWGLTKDQTTPDYKPGASFTYGAGTEYTLYAIWAKAYYYEITYDAKDGKFSNGQTIYVHKGEVTENPHHYDLIKNNLPTPNDETKEFFSWSEGDGKNDYFLNSNPGINITFTEGEVYKHTYFAKYNKKGSGEEGTIYIDGKPYSLYIYWNNTWNIVTPYIYWNNTWNILIE